jgi:hypothetical protein
MKGLRKFMGSGGGLGRFSLSYYSPDPDEDYWLYLAPQDAAVIGAALTAWAAAHGEKA